MTSKAGNFSPRPARRRRCQTLVANYRRLRAKPIPRPLRLNSNRDVGSGTVTAVIEIQYQGPSKNFSWLLPIVGVPKDKQLAIASNAAFQRLQQATNPQYNLTLRVEENPLVVQPNPFTQGETIDLFGGIDE